MSFLKNVLSSGKAYTGEESRALLSFANEGGGDVFAHWLRNELMRKLNYYSPNAIYLDNVAARSVSSSIMDAAHHKGGADFVSKARIADAFNVSLVGPDTRNVSVKQNGDFLDEDNGKYFRIGGMHKDWLSMWGKALSTSKVLIQIQTQEYADSSACLAEVAKIGQILQNPKSKIHVLAITFTNKQPKIPIQMGGVPRISKLMLGPTISHSKFSILKNLKDSWVINEADVQKIVKFMKAHGC